MRTGITFEVCVADRARLEAVVADRNSPQKHVWRAGIILATADGAGTVEIMRRTGKSKPCVWRWQERFMAEGVDGLLRDKTRPSRIPPLEPGVVLRIVDLTLTDPPAEATHWTAAMTAGKLGVSVSSVQRIWRAHGLQPHRVRQFKLSKDDNFADKLRDVAVPDERLQTTTVGRAQDDADSWAHEPDSHTESPAGIPFGIQMSDFIH